MGRFDGYLLCSDLDGTLLDDEKCISRGNIEAIEYFKAEGGKFTFCTGRVVDGVRYVLEYVRPNVPMICFNGAAIYDFETEKYLHTKPLCSLAPDAVSYIYDLLPNAAIDVCTAYDSFFCRTNRILERHKTLEHLKDNYVDFRDIKGEWMKVIFMTEPEELHEVRDAFKNYPYTDKFDFVQSCENYYEMLPKASGKGYGLKELVKILNADMSKTIGIGDNFNDIDLVRTAGIGAVVKNAEDEVKKAADMVVDADNNSDALKSLIMSL